MRADFRTKIALSILGAVSAGVLGYFIWNYLAASPGMPTVGPAPSASELNTAVVKDGDFKSLREYIDLPIKAPSAGRRNPFESWLPPAPPETPEQPAP